MNRHLKIGLLVFAMCGGLAICDGYAIAQPGRGELMYSTYCIACHAEQVHWREKKLVTDWSSLVAEVRRWQLNGNLEWSSDDIDVVARYLNAVHYRYPMPDK